MSPSGVLVLGGGDVQAALCHQEIAIMRAVQQAYELHASGQSSLPRSTFLSFPKNPANRIISLPAYLGGDFEMAGVKWISSFPANAAHGLDRASAVVILNSTETGRPEAILEGSVISAKRTAASAALASRLLAAGDLSTIGIIGCGPINFEVVRFLTVVHPGIRTLLLFDLDRARAQQFSEKCAQAHPALTTLISSSPSEPLGEAGLISFATTARKPYIAPAPKAKPGTVILHLSLRDLLPESILSSDNVVDDIDHVCQAETSVHLAERMTGRRDFIRCTLADIFLGSAAAQTGNGKPTVFSPFGLGILDMAVAKLACQLAQQASLGSSLTSFFPTPWSSSSNHEEVMAAQSHDGE